MIRRERAKKRKKVAKQVRAKLDRRVRDWYERLATGHSDAFSTLILGITTPIHFLCFYRVALSILRCINYYRCIWMTPNAHATCKAKRCQFGKITITRSMLNRWRWHVCMHVGTHMTMYFCVTAGLLLHVQCRMTVPDSKNSWTDCAQIWYTDRDWLVGCHTSQFEESHAVLHVQD